MITHKPNEFKYLFKLWLDTDAAAEAAGYENEHLNSLSELRWRECHKAYKAKRFIVTADDEEDYADTLAAFVEGTR